MDNDDFLIDNALETLYNFAETYQAELVCMEQGFVCNEEVLSQTLTEKSLTQKKSELDKLTLESIVINERAKKFWQRNYSWAPWTKFLLRDFLINNGIKFPQVKITEDVLWTFKLVCTAKNFLCIPDRLYVYRLLENSLSHVKRSPQDEIKFWLNPLVNGLDYLDEFLDRSNFFVQNPDYRFEVTKLFVKMQLVNMIEAAKNLSLPELHDVIRREFSKNNDRHATLVTHLFACMNFYRSECLNKNQTKKSKTRNRR